MESARLHRELVLLTLELAEAAFACGTEVDPRSTRFIIIERADLSPSEAELGELGSLGFPGSAEEIRVAVDRRRAELDSLSGPRVGRP